MKEEMIKKIEKLYIEGKISEAVKNKLLKEIEDLNRIKFEEKFKTNYKNIEISCIYEDIEIEGSDEVSNIIFEKGREGFEVEEDNNNLIINSKTRGLHIDIFGFKLGSDIYSENAKIILPLNSNLIINNISGNIDLEKIIGNIKLKTVSGDIRIKDSEGKIDCYTISGDINAKNIKGEFNIISKSGDINIDNIEEQGVIKTYSGDIKIKDGNFKKIFLSTFSGDQKLNNVNINDSMEIKNTSGDLSLNLLTKDIKILIENKTGEGRINYEGRITKIGRGEISFGDGNKKLFIKTTSGDININID